MNLHRTIGAAMLVLLTAVPALAEKSLLDQAIDKTPDQLISEIESQHPAIYYILAAKLFDSERKDEAVFWFYAGQLRFRFELAAHPNRDPAGDKALFAKFTQELGTPINKWAFGDLAMLEKTLGEVEAWDLKAPNGYTSKTEFAEQWKSTREGMATLVKYVRENGDTIRKQRTESGLVNRN